MVCKTNKRKWYRWVDILKANLHCACGQFWRKAIHDLSLTLEFNARGYYVNLLPKVLSFHRGSEVDIVWLINEPRLKFRSSRLMEPCTVFITMDGYFLPRRWISTSFLLFFEQVLVDAFLSLFRQLLILYLTFPFCNIQLRSFLELTCLGDHNDSSMLEIATRSQCLLSPPRRRLKRCSYRSQKIAMKVNRSFRNVQSEKQDIQVTL